MTEIEHTPAKGEELQYVKTVSVRSDGSTIEKVWQRGAWGFMPGLTAIAILAFGIPTGIMLWKLALAFQP